MGFGQQEVFDFGPCEDIDVEEYAYNGDGSAIIMLVATSYDPITYDGIYRRYFLGWYEGTATDITDLVVSATGLSTNGDDYYDLANFVPISGRNCVK